MPKQTFPEWYFNSSMAMARGAAAAAMYEALIDGNHAAYLQALADWQAACGGLKGCPSALSTCPWNPPDTDPKAAAIDLDPATGLFRLGGKPLPLA